MRAVGRTLGHLGTASGFPLAGVVYPVSTPTNEHEEPARMQRAGIKKRQTDRGVDRQMD